MTEYYVKVSFDSNGNLEELEIRCEGSNCECANVVNAVLDALKDNTEIENAEIKEE